MLSNWLPVTLFLSACGGTGSAKDAGPWADACGPVAADAGSGPHTLLSRISAPAVLKKACSPYALAASTTILAEVTIEAGVKIIGPQGGAASRITVTKSGKLLAAGTAEDPIVFTSTYAENGGGPYGGQWTGLLFLEAQPGSRLEHVVIEYAGGAYQATGDEFEQYEFPVPGSLLNDSTADLIVSDVWIRNSAGYAVAATTSAEFELADSNLYAAFERVTLTDNKKVIWVPVDQAGTLGTDLCFSARDTAGACPHAGSPAEGSFIEAHMDDRLGRTPENVTRDATWKAYRVPWKVDNVNIVNNALLTILDGAELRMTDVGGIAVGINGPSALRMVAAQPGGIRVTTAYEDPEPAQYWNGIWLWSLTDGARTELRNVDLGWGGKKAPTATEAPALITIFNANPTIAGNHVHHSLGSGIHWSCTAMPNGLSPDNPGRNTSEPSTLACADRVGGGGIAQNYGCVCGVSSCSYLCPQPDP